MNKLPLSWVPTQENSSTSIVISTILWSANSAAHLQTVLDLFADSTGRYIEEFHREDLLPFTKLKYEAGFQNEDEIWEVP